MVDLIRLPPGIVRSFLYCFNKSAASIFQLSDLLLTFASQIDADPHHQHMNVTKRLSFLLIGMLIMSSFAFAGGSHMERQFWTNKAIAPSLSKPDFRSFQQPANIDAFSKATTYKSSSNATHVTHLNKKPARCKKLFKRTVNFPSSPAPPTKEIDNASHFIPTKEIYSKPYFLSHLHHFLFRLTPF